MQYRDVISANISMLLISVAAQFFNSPNYINLPLIVTTISLLLLSGILLLLRINFPFARLLVLLELIASILIYSLIYKIIPLSLSIFFIFLIFIGELLSILSEISLGIYIVIIFILLTKLKIAFFGTDEIMISYYSAYLFLHGINPYNPSSTINVYQFYHLEIPQPFETPTTTGELVTNLNYPSLIFLIQIPAVLLKVSPSYTLLVFFLATLVLYYFILRKQNSLHLYPILMAGIYLNLNYFYYVIGGVTDIIWVFFLSLSLFIKDVKMKGLFYGLAVAVKQIPLLLLPFIIVYLYKEKLSILKFLIFSLTSFLILNGYFIFLNPKYYFYDISYPISANLIGIGIGPSIFSFNGTFYIYKTFFTISMIIITVMEMLLFILFYSKFKNNWTAFPYFILFMNYRVLWNYLMYWPFFNFINKENSNDPIEDLSKLDKRKIIGIITISIITLVSLAFYFHYAYVPYYTSIHISVIKVFEKDGLIYSVILNLSYVPTSNALPSEIHPYFRIFPNQPMISANGLLWDSNASTIPANSWSIVKIWAPNEILEFKFTEFLIQAYYGDLVGNVLVIPSQAS